MQEVDRRSRDLGRLDRVLGLLGVGVFAGLLLGLVPLPSDSVLSTGRQGVLPALAVIAGVIAVGIDVPSRSRRLFAIFTAVAAAHLAWAIQSTARAAAGDPSLVVHGVPAVALAMLGIAMLIAGFVSLCGAMIGSSKHFGAEIPEAEWKATLRFGGRAGLVLVGAGILGSLSYMLGSDAGVIVSVLAAVVAAFATFIKALTAGAATRRWISEARRD